MHARGWTDLLRQAVIVCLLSLEDEMPRVENRVVAALNGKKVWFQSTRTGRYLCEVKKSAQHQANDMSKTNLHNDANTVLGKNFRGKLRAPVRFTLVPSVHGEKGCRGSLAYTFDQLYPPFSTQRAITPGSLTEYA
jgi:hypothetical protein